MTDPSQHPPSIEEPPKRYRRTSPSLHLLAIVFIFGLTFIGYLAIVWSGDLRGFSPNKVVAGRDLAFLVPLLFLFFWLTRSRRYRGEMLPLTAAVFLFAFGLLIQFRLFSDPEYGGVRGERAAARRAKAQATRLLNIQTGYDDEKKKFLFGDQEVPAADEVADGAPSTRQYTLVGVLNSVNTYIPLAAILALAIGFSAFKSERVLLWLQRHAMLLGIGTLLPFLLIVVLFSEEGKFLGQTTPWEGVKILFLISFAGMLSDAYRHLRRTRWGLPPARYLLPFTALAAMPVVPFFVLSDFGQMLVFLGVYVMLYVVAVRHKAQLAYAIVAVLLVFGIFSAASGLKTGFGVPARVYFRFYQWTHTWESPAPDTWWWKADYERYLKAKRLNPELASEREVRQWNSEAWSDKVYQQSQGLFGVHEGGVVGEGLGLGFPETVPLSDSDFIYAAVAEETGLAGALALLLALCVFVVSGVAISLGSDDMFTKLVAAGFTAFAGFQALVNIGGVLRLLPMTGITLPFVSHGGWSLITSFGMLGILLAISHRNATATAVKSGASERPELAPIR